MTHWVLERFFTVGIGLLVLNEKNKEPSAVVNITNMQQGGWSDENNPSTHNGSNVDTGASEITISA